MSTALAGAGNAALLEQLDTLSIRLMVEGPEALTAADLQQLSALAELSGETTFAAHAARLATICRPGASADQQSALVDELRLALEPAAAPPPASTPAKPSPVSQVSLAEDKELILEFITESREHLGHIEAQMLLLEKDASASETLNAVFRAFHTIKGLAGFLEFAHIQSLAHEVETLLDLARNGKLIITSAIVDLVLEATDIVRRELSAIESSLAGEAPGPTSVTKDLLARLHAASHADADAQPDAIAPLSPTPQPAQPPANPQPEATGPAPQPTPAAVATVLAAVAAAPAEPARAAQPAKAGEAATLRIDTSKLDQLMDLVGEMVIAQTLIAHSPAIAAVTDARVQTDLTQLARITADVQHVVTGMRMIPIGTQFQKTARLIRDLSRRAGKQIVLETSGDETEIDKSIADELSDPLLHMVRNSVDHGIETTEERLATGKDPVARVRLGARHESGQIVISISDDGRGLNKEKILKRALQNGIIQPGAQLTENEIFLLIFEPGFSTAETITDISGRGVGMDVVKRHVQKLRGRIEVHSAPGKGTEFLLKLPLTLAIIEGLVTLVGEQRYIVPIFAVREMFRPTPEMLSTIQGKKEMVLVRGGLLPIIRLHERFDTPPRSANLTEGILIVAEAETRQFCLFVDELVGKQEVVIKGLGRTFKDVIGVAGCAILGDGRVGLILDMLALFRGAR